MARYIEYSAPSANSAIDQTRVCKGQLITAGVPLKLNGNWADLAAGTVSLKRRGAARTLYIHPVFTDLTGVNFTIKGFQNNVLISEQVAGSDDKVETTQAYDEIISITPDTATEIKAVDVGLGEKGFFTLEIDTKNQESVDYALTIINNQKDKLKNVKIYTSLDQDILYSYQDQLGHITANTRVSDLYQYDSVNNVEYNGWTSNDIGLTKFIIVYFEIDHTADSLTTLRFLQK
jgi:hypothetical protein